MALWKIEMKQSGIVNGVRIEKGMFVELATTSSTPPLSTSTNNDTIGQLFFSKYGIDVISARLINQGRMACTRIQ